MRVLSWDVGGFGSIPVSQSFEVTAGLQYVYATPSVIESQLKDSNGCAIAP